MREDLKATWDGPGQRFKRLLLSLLGVAPEVVTAEFGDGLLALCHLQWVRPLGEWAFWAIEDDPHQQFCHLAEHLAMRWPMPGWVIDGLLNGSRRDLRFLRALIEGHSLRRLAGGPLLPVRLSRQACHRLLAAPSRTLGFVGNLRTAQLEDAGAKQHLAAALIAHRRSMRLRSRRREERLAQAYGWMSRHQDVIPRADVGLVFEMLISLRTYPFARRGPARVLDDARTLRDEPVEGLARLLPGASAAYRSSGLPGGTWAEMLNGNIHVWSVNELLSSSKLYWEGIKMRHCVRSYHAAVAEGSTSIWSLRRNGRRALTIEVRNPRERIVQVRGRTNRAPHAHELRALQRWAGEAGLELSDTAVL
ncbi:MAG: PcfJ domain-containing protein [Deltaproteobacteria bacterium]|nr:PcfJ domain-containing protein [Deltaproteobacteria bacterium]